MRTGRPRGSVLTGVCATEDPAGYARAYYYARVRRADFIDKRFRSKPLRETQWATRLRKNIKKRARAAGFEWSPLMTAAWLHEQWEHQGGRCFYTGIPMRLEIAERKRGMYRPSMDRRDPSRGYTPENVVLCLTAVNYLKNDYAEGAVMALLEEIRTSRPS